jgi:hypothetical protein
LVWALAAEIKTRLVSNACKTSAKRNVSAVFVGHFPLVHKGFTASIEVTS